MDKQSILDKSYEEIQNLKDLDTIKEIVENFPVIITLGDQSSGKSSIFSRIIEKQLPTKNGCCTRVPIMISTRRTPGELTINTNLTGNENFYNNEIDNFEEAINKAQEICLDGNIFSTNMVKITIYNKPYDLTFIDLPGLTARDVKNSENQQNRVYDILENIKDNYTKSIIFHIIDANIEPENSNSILELNDIIKKDNKRKIITIYTKTDKLEDMNNFNILDSKIKGEKFIMNGIENCDEIQPLNCNYNIGKNYVLEYLNEINIDNIEKNYNLFFDKIKQKISEIDKKLKNELRPFEEIREQNRIIKETKKILLNNFKIYKNNFKNKRDNIFRNLKSLRAFESYEDIVIENFEELKKGDIIYYWDNYLERKIKTSIFYVCSEYIQFYKKHYDGCEDDENSDCDEDNEIYNYYFTSDYYFDNDIRFCRVVARKCHKDNIKSNFTNCYKWFNVNYKKEISTDANCKCHSLGIHCECLYKTKSQICNDCSYTLVDNNTGKFWLEMPDRDIIDEIKTILEESGELQPDIMKDHTSVVHNYSKQFAEKCKEEMCDLNNYLNVDIIEKILINNIKNEEIKLIVKEIISVIYSEVEKEIEKLYMKNSIESLISTPNNHYYSENILRAIKRNDTLLTDDAYYKIANCKVEAFIKVQSKYVIERADEIFNLHYYYIIKKMIENFDDYDLNEINGISNYFLEPLERLNFIKVENDYEIERMREKALNDKEILDKIISFGN